MIATSEVRRVAASTLGALLLSATCIAGAVAPASAQEPAMTPNAPLTVADWQEAVGEQLDARLTLPAGAFARRDHYVATVDVSFDSEGSFAGARVAQGSGAAAVDRHIVRIARAIAYPPLPLGYRGRPQTVTLQAYLGMPATSLETARHEAAIEALVHTAPAHAEPTQTAALPSG